MRKLAIITVGVLAIPVVTLAAPAPKVFVCKYVGTPGADERLQTGQNPISVSSNAIKDYEGVGSYFNDAQGRSYVLAEDTGQPEPNVSQCPAVTVTPPTPPVTPPSSTPVVTTPTPQSVTTTPPTPGNPTSTTTTGNPGEIDFTNFVGK